MCNSVTLPSQECIYGCGYLDYFFIVVIVSFIVT
jgi:hypothetical protein